MAEPGLAGLVLAAGSGTRLRPLTHLRPKVLCPVGDRPLVDHALDRALASTRDVTVNVHLGAARIAAHVAGRARIAREHGEALETAGAIGALRDWIDGRDLLVLNGDTWHPQAVDELVEGWDRERVRLCVVETGRPADFGTLRYVGAALLPWAICRELPPVRAGLYREVIAPAEEDDRLDLWESAVPAYDCGTPAEYLAANLAFLLHLLRAGGPVAGGARPGVESSVVGAGAVVHGEVRRSVVWPGAVVEAGERLEGAIRAAPGFTVHVASAAWTSGWPPTVGTVPGECRVGEPDG